MKSLRFRSLLGLNVLIAATGLTAVSASAQELQVAKNIGDVREAVTATATISQSNESIAKAGVYSPSNLNRVGVQTAQPVPISLNEAIRRSLQNNNDIEVSRDDVRFHSDRLPMGRT